ncbi:MAG: diaminopimelate epimerase [Christensenellales bacterium]|jgi:diaminopimelate epimerase
MDFTKMHGLGNDFLVFEDKGPKRDWNALAKEVCQRRLSVGGDGILIVMPSDKADIRMRIINADGSEAEMCGNGVRCFAKYVYETGIVKKTDMTVETLAGIICPKLQIENGIVTGITVDMGRPYFDRESIPMNGSGDTFDIPIDVAGQTVIVSSVLMGVPHTMVLTDDIDTIDAAVIGPSIEKHPLFPKKTNVNFVTIIDRRNIKILTWERGAGLTLACGTGSCASVVALSKKGLIDKKATVHLKAGTLDIEWLNDGRVLMTGPATRVYRASLTQ